MTFLKGWIFHPFRNCKSYNDRLNEAIFAAKKYLDDILDCYETWEEFEKNDRLNGRSFERKEDFGKARQKQVYG